MFFPSSTGLLDRRISHKINNNDETKKIPKPVFDVSEFNRTYKTVEDHIRKTYGDNKINIIKSGGSNPETIEIRKRQKLECGVRQFLSNNGKTTHLVRFEKGVPQDEPVDFDCLLGKYLLICCFDVPMLTRTEYAPNCRAIINVYKELSELGYPFEMVVVANMRADVVYDVKAAFNHFYSAFSCLAIPFSDFETRDYIHLCMRLSLRPDCNSAILVDPEEIVLQDDRALSQLYKYGSEWAPSFHRATLKAIEKQDEVLRSRLDPMYSIKAFLSSKLHPMYSDIAIDDPQPPLSLYQDILLCDPNQTLRRLGAAETDVDVSCTVQDLSRKYVGLYLFIDGEIMEDIKAAHDHCLANNQQLEILLVPFYDQLESYYEQVKQVLRLLNIKSWFLFYSNYYHRLWRKVGGVDYCPCEKFIIIPPNCESGELLGREVIINLGIHEYPFTRTAILKRRLQHVRSLTPIFTSLFNNYRMIQNGRDFKSKQLQGKNVLLYLTWSDCDKYKPLKKHYPEIKAMGWEFVFVLLDDTGRYWNKQIVDHDEGCNNCPCVRFKEMPWPYYQFPSAAAKASIKKQLFFPENAGNAYLFAVGKDGMILSTDVEDRLNTDGVTKSLFDDVLEADLACGLAKIPFYYGGF